METSLAGLGSQPAARSFVGFQATPESHAHSSAACQKAGTARGWHASETTGDAVRAYSKPPEFTATDGSPPSFTAGPNPGADAPPAGSAAGSSTGAPEFTAGGGSGPGFTAGPDVGAGGAAGAQASGDGGGSWDGNVEDALQQVQAAALAHVVRGTNLSCSHS